MNGRVYDYNLGRFMSVDPLIHGGSQGLNPYSYIMNNPLSGTDPTGYEPETETVELQEGNQIVQDADGNLYVDQGGDTLTKVEKVTVSTNDGMKITANYSNGHKIESGSIETEKGIVNVTDIGSESQKTTFTAKQDDHKKDTPAQSAGGCGSMLMASIAACSTIGAVQAASSFDATGAVNKVNTILKIKGIRDAAHLAEEFGNSVRAVQDLVIAAEAGDAAAYEKVKDYLRAAGIKVRNIKVVDLMHAQKHNTDRIPGFQADLGAQLAPMVIGEYISFGAAHSPRALAFGFELLGFAVNISSSE